MTHHLQVGDPVLPPQVLLEFWAHRGEHIIEVPEATQVRFGSAESQQHATQNSHNNMHK